MTKRSKHKRNFDAKKTHTKTNTIESNEVNERTCDGKKINRNIFTIFSDKIECSGMDMSIKCVMRQSVCQWTTVSMKMWKCSDVICEWCCEWKWSHSAIQATRCKRTSSLLSNLSLICWQNAGKSTARHSGILNSFESTKSLMQIIFDWVSRPGAIFVMISTIFLLERISNWKSNWNQWVAVDAYLNLIGS